MVVGKRTHDEATAAENSSGNNDNDDDDDTNENENNMDIAESGNDDNSENQNNMDVIFEEEENGVGTSNRSEESMDATTAEAVPATATAADMTGAPTENEQQHQQAQEQESSPNTPEATISECARKTVKECLSGYDEKSRDAFVKYSVIGVLKHLSTQEAKSKERLASRLEGNFDVLRGSGMFPDVKCPDEDATLWSAVMDSFWRNLIDQKALQGPEIPGRIAPLDFRIVSTESKLSHPFDRDSFIQRVLWMKDTWKNQITNEKPTKNKILYDAPYFCFIQSSGMGKTKIMYEAIRELNDVKNSSEYGCWKCALVIPGPGQLRDAFPPVADAGSSKVAFDQQIDFPSFPPDNSIADHTKACFLKLDELLQNVTGVTPSPLPSTQPPNARNPPPQKTQHISVLLCFDEAQAFLSDIKWNENGNKAEKTERAYLFRVIRMWLRMKKHSLYYAVVAVFAGTTASIANFRFDQDADLLKRPEGAPPVIEPSRHWSQSDEMHDKRSEYFPVFTSTTTIGCLAKSTLLSTQEDSECSYKRAIPYGRPLFAMLDHVDKFPASVQLAILGRMLQHENTNEGWKKNEACQFSVLATRVQMGQTIYSMASKLVANGYANLLGVSAKQVRITYMPDPVCARLAMGMMSETFQLGQFRGAGGAFWAKKLSELFQRGLCIPEKGDSGEIFVALYFLLCGDSLRTTTDNFTIPLDEWIGRLKRGGRCPDNRVNPVSAGSVASPITLESGIKVSINFIQVCRNNLRSFGLDWVGFKNQTFLRYLFDSAIAFYVYPMCPLIDLVAPIKIERLKKETLYVPLLVSIKSREDFGPAKAAKEFEKMKEKAQASELETALCLIVVFGSSVKSTDHEEFVLNDDSVAQALLDKKIVAKILRIPMDDEFTLSKQFLAVTSPGLETEELLASHSFIRAFHGDENELKLENALRAEPSMEATRMLKELQGQLK